MIETGEGQENRAEFNAVLCGLQADLQPEGMVEEMLVERMAVAYWRLRRAIRAEVGELRQELDNAHFDDIDTRKRHFHDHRPVAILPIHREELRRTGLGTEHFINELQAARDEVEKYGRLHEPGMTSVLRYFGKDPDGAGVVCDFLTSVSRAIVNGHPVPEGGEELTVQACKEKMLLILDDELRSLRIVNEGLEEIEEQRVQARIAASHVPNAERYDRLLRYERAIERQFYRAAHELERLQRARLGLAVPPPVTVEVDVSHPQD